MLSYSPFSDKTKNISPNLCRISEHLQDELLTKLLGPFMELHKSNFFSKTRKFDLRLYCSLFLQHFEKLGVNLSTESIYMEEEYGL